MKRNIKQILLISATFLVLLYSGIFQMEAKSPQMKSEEVISRMKTALSKYVSAEITFNFDVISPEGEMLMNDAGFFSVQGDAYKLSTGDYSVYCNGTSKWVHDVYNQEITIYPFTAEGAEFLENTFFILKNMNMQDFKIPVRSAIDEKDNELSYKLVIEPKDDRATYKKVIIYVRADTFIPATIDYLNKNDDRYVVNIASIVNVPERSLAFFAPDDIILEDEEIYITDLRD